MELMEKVDTLVVDKTGTLTEGRPRVTAIVSGWFNFRNGTAKRSRVGGAKQRASARRGRRERRARARRHSCPRSSTFNRQQVAE